MVSDVQSQNCIQNDYQKIVLVSNPIRGGEIAANETADSSNMTGNNVFATDINFQNKNLTKNSFQTNWNFIHNLSTGLKNDISIRAP